MLKPSSDMFLVHPCATHMRGSESRAPNELGSALTPLSFSLTFDDLIGYPASGCGERYQPCAAPKPPAGLPRYLLGDAAARGWLNYKPVTSHLSTNSSPTNFYPGSPDIELSHGSRATFSIYTSITVATISNREARLPTLHNVVYGWRRMLDLRQPPQPIPKACPR